MKTIAQQLNVTDFPFIIKNKNNNVIYYENSTGCWDKWEHDSKGRETSYQNSDGDWSKWEYDSEGNEIYYEDSDGVIQDNRPSENIERIREFFRQVRLKKHHHLGLGAIKLTVEQQEELCELVESLINKRIDQ